MKPSLTLILLILLAFGCGRISNYKNNSGTDQGRKDTSKISKKETPAVDENVRLQFGESYEINNGFTIVPVILNEIYREKGETERTFSNLIFVDPAHKIRTLDSLSNWQINNIQVFEFDPDNLYSDYSNGFEVTNLRAPSLFEDYLLLQLQNTRYSVDTNNLKKEERPVYSRLAIVKTDGTGFGFLTPANANFESFSINQNSNMIIASYIIDKNNDGKLNEVDGSTLSYTTISGSSYATSILVDSELEKKLLSEYKNKIAK